MVGILVLERTQLWLNVGWIRDTGQEAGPGVCGRRDEELELGSRCWEHVERVCEGGTTEVAAMGPARGQKCEADQIWSLDFGARKSGRQGRVQGL